MSKLCRLLRIALPSSLFAAAACTTGPVTGNTVEASTGYRVPFSGYTDTKATPINTYVMSSPNADPATAPFTFIGSALSGSSPLSLGSPTLAYQWNVTSNPLTAAQWPSGGLVRLKTRSRFNGATAPADMQAFDTYGPPCLFDEVQAGGSWIAAGNDCQTPYLNFSVITLASTETTPIDKNFGQIRYLGIRGNFFPPPALQSANIQTLYGDNYYAKSGAPATFGDFKSKYGFVAGAPIRAVYYNHGDLGVARDMNCNATTIGGAAVRACYVSNYGRSASFPHGAAGFGPDSLDPQVALQEALGPQGHPPLSGNAPLATVAMVYNAALPANARVQFMVYGEDGLLTTEAALDNEGLSALSSVAARSQPTSANVAVPDNCLTCHGTSSTYTPSTSGPATVTGARFLPFDPAGFEFATFNPSFAKPAMLDKLKQLNALVLDTEPSPAITELVKGMYPSASGLGPKDAAATFSDAYVPTGWTLAGSEGKLARQVYNEVVKPYCRTCHVSHAPGTLDWTTYASFKSMAPVIGSYACNNNSTNPMPQAEQTQTRFWNSGARAHLVSAFNITGACAP